MKRNSIYFLSIILLLISACRSLKETQKSKTLSEISYETDVKPIIQNYCITCHAGEKPAGDFRLTTYQEVRLQAEKGNLLNRINDEQFPMPMGGLMPKNERKTLELWAKNGFQEKNKASNLSNKNTEIGFSPPKIVPIDINQQGFEFFDLMQGHWIGKMNIIGKNYDWFSFDYRPISASHIHGIYEGGTIGNLFTSFFITDFNGKRTIMARNGGILNGTYRTSYFVLDKVELTKNRKYFRLIDAYGGKEIMWMELEFMGDKLNFNSYTSRFGLNGKPKQHMKFQAEKKHLELSNQRAKAFNYPQNKVEKDFSKGLPKPNWGEQYPVITSASYVYQATNIELEKLAKLAGDPFGIEEIPYLSSLKINIELNEKIKNQNLIVYLSKDALTDENGNFKLEYGEIKQELFDGIFLFPDLAQNQKEFTFNYLHPGNYYLTIIADINKDGYASKGDICNKSLFLSVKPNSKSELDVKNIKVQN